ncbi:MAG: diaminopimelate epimerase [Gammaproteobacteria bacterium]|nr:diaminopimelate epimerase [Gammaproteobacteria bacterium]
MRLEFVKMHGLGNDFLLIDLPTTGTLPTSAEWRALADRRTGIGFDQALVIGPPRAAEHTASYRIFNADGSEAQQCGNGVRCIAALLAARGHAPQRELQLESSGGVVRARVLDDGQVAVEMGVPDFRPSALPLLVPAEALHYTLQLADREVRFGAVSIGNPHAVLEVDDVDAAPVQTIGPALQRHSAFPQGVNVGFMQILDAAHIRLRVFERGAGETRACGTGACAAVAVGRRHGRLGAHVDVALPGGVLQIDWPGPGASLWMTGPAVEAFRGSVEL